MIKKLSIFGLLLAVLLPISSLAADFASPTDRQGNLLITSGTYEDLYSAGANLSVKTPIGGDLFAAGGVVTIDGSVKEDLFAASGNLTVTGAVNGDARLAGGSIMVSSAIAQDALIAGGTINLTSSSRIGKDLTIAGGSVVIDASVGGKLRVAGDDILINGTVNGEVMVTAGRLTFGPQARIKGKITYKGRNEAVVQEGAQISAIEFKKMERGMRGDNYAVPFLAFLTFGFFINLLGWLIAGVVVLSLLGGLARSVTNLSYTSAGRSLLTGLIGIIVIPVLIIVLFFTLIGYPIALLLLFAFMLSMAMSGVLSAIFIGSSILKWIRKTKEPPLTWLSAVVGVIAFTVLNLIPVVGWIVTALIFLTTFGSLLQSINNRRE